MAVTTPSRALTIRSQKDLSRDVLLEGTARAPPRTLDGHLETLTSTRLSGPLRTARGTKAKVPVVNGSSYQVYVGELRETFAKISQRDGRQARARVALVEA
jgi:hypothetical protein